MVTPPAFFFLKKGASQALSSFVHSVQLLVGVLTLFNELTEQTFVFECIIIVLVETTEGTNNRKKIK